METEYFAANKDFIIGQILDNKKQLYRMGVEHLRFCGFEEKNGQQIPVLAMQARPESKVDLIDFEYIVEKLEEILEVKVKLYPNFKFCSGRCLDVF